MTVSNDINDIFNHINDKKSNCDNISNASQSCKQYSLYLNFPNIGDKNLLAISECSY